MHKVISQCDKRELYLWTLSCFALFGCMLFSLWASFCNFIDRQSPTPASTWLDSTSAAVCEGSFFYFSYNFPPGKTKSCRHWNWLHLPLLHSFALHLSSCDALTRQFQCSKWVYIICSLSRCKCKLQIPISRISDKLACGILFWTFEAFIAAHIVLICFGVLYFNWRLLAHKNGHTMCEHFIYGYWQGRDFSYYYYYFL